jgi:signal peptidase I
MSPSSFNDGDPPAIMNGEGLESPAGNGEPGGAAGSGRDARGAAVAPATDGRAAQKLDHRLRGLRIEPGDDVPVASPRTERRRRFRRSPLLTKVVVFVAATALVVLLLRAFVIQPFAVPGDAMAPTLQAGDRILVLKSSFLAGPIHSGEIIVFEPPKSLPCTVVGGRSGDLVLRVVAVPGDVIWSVGETIFLDGRPLREPGWYDPRLGQVGSTPIHSTTLGAGQYFVLADNRADACDSRVFGPISRSSVVGEAIAIIGRHGHVSFGTL